MARTLMIQGTTSDAGKSVLATALCRLLRRRGVRVAPFKPQNMALNSAVTIDGGEIGRAQAVQARACGLEPHTDMNPILLKPNSDIGSQVILNGRTVGNMDARAYHDFKPEAKSTVFDAFQRLASNHEVIIVEGAGSPAEINLRANDIANMGFAEMVDCPVLLVGDIDRGGVFAQFVGTLALLSTSERRRLRGFFINRFRGDPTLLDPGLADLQRRTRRATWGVLPFLPGLFLEAEDSFFTGQQPVEDTVTAVRVVVPRLPRISNHTDLDPLRAHPRVHLHLVEKGQPIPNADLIILPGSKSSRADLNWLRANGWETAIQRHLRYGGKVIGICGGFQMLGRTLADPDGLEGPPGSEPGLGLLTMNTLITREKRLQRHAGRLLPGNVPVAGYRIHMGRSEGPALENPALILDGQTDGARSADGRILGCYLHGLLDHPRALHHLLTWAAPGLTGPEIDIGAIREESIDRLADSLETHMDRERFATVLPI